MEGIGCGAGCEETGLMFIAEHLSCAQVAINCLKLTSTSIEGDMSGSRPLYVHRVRSRPDRMHLGERQTKRARAPICQ